MTPGSRASCFIPIAGNENNRPILSLFILLSVLLGLVATTTAWADDDDDRIDIDRASWSNDRDRLSVRGDKAPDRTTVTIRYGNRGDNGAVIGTTQSDGDGDWSFRISGDDLGTVPCDVTAQAAGVRDDDREVSRAPNNCSNDGGGGIPNVPPTANAGPDQTVTLASGQTTIAVTLNGSGSSDSDGTIASYNWTGTPDPANVVSPTVNLAAGSHTFTLVVTDNDGDSSAGDTVVITVNPAAPGNQAPTANAGPNQTVTLASGQTTIPVTLNGSGSSDPDGTIATYNWTGNPDPVNVVSPTVDLGVGSFTFTLVVTDNNGDSSVPDTVVITVNDAVAVVCNPATQNLSINSTSQDGCPEQTVSEVNTLLNGAYRVVAINDLGMHCGDLDTRISSILPPFQVLLGQVIQRGSTPTLNPAGVALEYSAASNPNDPILGQPDSLVQRGLKDDGSTYKTNFWDAVAGGAYDAFYPSIVTPLLTGPFPVTADIGLPVPNVEELYIGADGVVDQPGGSSDGTLTAVQHAMPGLAAPYLLNDPQTVNEHYGDKPFFVNFPFGYVAENVNWYEGAGIPFAAYDDFGRENAYPLVRVEAKQGNNTVATIDTVLPISGEASCTNCHSDPADVQNSRTSQPTDTLSNAGLPVATSLDDPDPTLPNDVSVEYAADINILRLHDLKHGANYVNTAGASTPCDVTANGGDGDATCLINIALVQGKPAVCQVCHYTPALDLAHVGPVAGPPGTDANGRNQVAHPSNSNVMHSHHGSLGNLFPPMPAPVQAANGTITNQAARLAVLEDTCYQCHPGTNVQCLRGAMFNGDMLCNDCHGSMEQVGNDFSAGVSPQNPGGFVLNQGNFYDPNSNQPRVPWANEPGCGSCHTGDTSSNLAGTANTITNTRDVDGNVDNLRLRQAYRSGDAKATPIVPTNKRFAEPAVPATFANADGSTFANPGAGNPQLYRVSTGHGGVMCEGCHGATHAEWPNANPLSNDNVTAEQLQGHTGAITECSSCHTDLNALGTNGSTNSLRGPHGMHVVGNTSFANGGHRQSLNRNACRTCHGQNGEGSVLSRTAADRNLPDVGFVAKGTPIRCNMCHGNEL